ncbi:MAG: nucleoside triphosphate pyrophosphohydrolase [Clostridiales bacterium]|jgi:tetrapyrrole methylase family protein/MazG family protein|nr:nucleoside triphosphate pyrophosphohydrolase [Clostridiales bacterium]
MAIDLNKPRYDFNDLNDILSVLLGENGCPWDRAQTHESVMTCLIEECYEVIDAVEKNDKAALREELGDVLLQVVFNAKLAENTGSFSIAEVIDGISRKMIGRHTHIFGAGEAETPDAVLDLWERNKRKEKGYQTASESIARIPKAFPALMRAAKAQKKAAEAGFEAKTLRQTLDETLLSLENLKRATESEKADRYGDFLLKSAHISCFLKINPELALTNALETYINKFEDFESASEK